MAVSACSTWIVMDSVMDSNGYNEHCGIFHGYCGYSGKYMDNMDLVDMMVDYGLGKIIWMMS